MKEYEIQEATHLQQTSESLGPSFIHLANLKEPFRKYSPLPGARVT